jgi:hypothetical protein
MKLKDAGIYKARNGSAIQVFEDDGKFSNAVTHYSIVWDREGQAWNVWSNEPEDGYDLMKEVNSEDIPSDPDERLVYYTDYVLNNMDEQEVIEYVFDGFVFTNENAVIRFGVLKHILENTPPEDLDKALYEYATKIEHCYV